MVRRLVHGPDPRSPNNVVGGDTSRLGLAGLCVLMVIILQLSTGNFVTIGNATTTLLNGAQLLIVSIAGAALLISGNIDLSVGGMYSFLTVLAALIARETQSIPATVSLSLLVGLGVGMSNGLLVRTLKINPLIVTIGTGFAFQGAAYVLASGSTVFGLPEQLTNFGGADLLGVPVVVWLALAVFVVGGLILKRTIAGVRTYAIGGSAQACIRNGIKVGTHVVVLYALSGLSVGVIGILTAAQLGSGDPNTGGTFELDVLTAILLGGIGFQGGTGRPTGLFLGVLTLEILNGGMVFLGLPYYSQLIAKGVVLVAALGFDQYRATRADSLDGWFGRRRENGSERAVARSSGEHDEPAGPEPASESTLAKNGPGTDSVAPLASAAVVAGCVGIGKRYGPVWANREVSFTVTRGRITCIVGDNGAGKSTLIKMMSGAESPDEGTLTFGGQPITYADPASAKDVGIRTVYQDLALCGNLSPVLNLVLGEEPARGPGWLRQLRLFDVRAAGQVAAERTAALGVEIDSIYRPVERMSGGQRQAVAIARALEPGASLVIFDEPTAALGVRESAAVLQVVRRVAAEGAGVVLISHDIATVLAIADDVVVLHLGEKIFEAPRTELDESSLVRLMSGVVPDAMAHR